MPFQDRYVFEKMRHIVFLLKAKLTDMPLTLFILFTHPTFFPLLEGIHGP